MGSVLKGVAWLTIAALATVGGLTFVPDGAWESFPASLNPVRAKLASIGVAPTRYCSPDDAPGAGFDKPIGVEYFEPAQASVESERFASQTAEEAGEPSPSRVKIGGRVVGAPLGQNEKTNVLDSTPAEPKKTSLESNFNGVATELANDASERAETSPIDKPLGYSDGREDPGAPNQNDPAPLASDNFPAGNDEEFFNTPSFPSVPSLSAPTNDPGDLSFSQSSEIPAPAPEQPTESTFAPTSPAFASSTPEKENALATSVDPSLSAREALQSLKEETQSPDSIPAMPTPQTAAPPQVAQAPNPPVVAAEPTQVHSLQDQAVALQQAASCDPTYVDPNCAVNPPNPSNVSGADRALEETLRSAQNIETAEQARDVFLKLNELRRAFVAAGAVAQIERVNAALDRLAYEVFYNPQRAILEPLRQIKPGETLETIARECQVAPETLAAINGFSAPVDSQLAPGSTIKVVRGPVTAELSISKKELLLNFNNLYAGRFKFGTPQQAANLRGAFIVENKIENPVCDAVDTSGAKLTISGGAPNNPLGSCWIGLNGGYGLQGTNRPELVGVDVPENGGFVFSNREISQLNLLLPIGATVYFTD